MMNGRWANQLPALSVTLLIAIAFLCLIDQASALPLQDPPASSDVAAQGVESSTGGEELSSGEASGINFLALLARGGWFMVPLLILSLGVVAIGLERLISLRRSRVFPNRFVKQLSRLSSSPGGLEPRAAYEICQRHPSAAATVFKSLLVKVGRPQSELEHTVSETGQRQATRMLQLVSWLSLAAAIAPLIGLLGTVWGITQAFYDTTQLVAGQNRAEALAEGIYTALVTTMFGLIIAIPSAVLAHFFENRVVSMMNEVEEMIFNLMPQLERYEGKLRFSADQDLDGVNGDQAVTGDSHDEPSGKRRRPKAGAPK